MIREQIKVAIEAVGNKMTTSEITDLAIAIMNSPEETIEALELIVAENLAELSRL